MIRSFIFVGTIAFTSVCNGSEPLRQTCIGGVCERVANRVEHVTHAAASVVGDVVYGTVHSVHAVGHGVATGLAQSKSNIQARQGRMRHVGGSFGGGRYEGVGYSTISADHAIRSSCYWGRKTPIEIGVARGRHGWYATVIYR